MVMAFLKTCRKRGLHRHSPTRYFSPRFSSSSSSSGLSLRRRFRSEGPHNRLFRSRRAISVDYLANRIDINDVITLKAHSGSYANSSDVMSWCSSSCSSLPGNECTRTPPVTGTTWHNMECHVRHEMDTCLHMHVIAPNTATCVWVYMGGVHVTARSLQGMPLKGCQAWEDCMPTCT